MRNFSDGEVTEKHVRPASLHSLADVVAGRLRAARKDAGLTLLEVAVHCRTSAQTIQRLETNNMSLSVDWVGKMAAAIGIDPLMLFADLESPPYVFERRVHAVREEAAVLRARAEAFIAALDSFLQATAGEVAS